MEINLKGTTILIDDEDLSRFIKFKWHITMYGYAARSTKISGKSGIVFLHHEVFGRREGFLVDHINGCRLDNRKSNLRFVDRVQHARNRGGVKGYCYRKRIKKFQAYIVVDNKQIHLGVFKEEQDAAHAAEEGRVKYFGEHRRINGTY